MLIDSCVETALATPDSAPSLLRAREDGADEGFFVSMLTFSGS